MARWTPTRVTSRAANAASSASSRVRRGTTPARSTNVLAGSVTRNPCLARTWPESRSTLEWRSTPAGVALEPPRRGTVTAGRSGGSDSMCHNHAAERWDATPVGAVARQAAAKSVSAPGRGAANVQMPGWSGTSSPDSTRRRSWRGDSPSSVASARETTPWLVARSTISRPSRVVGEAVSCMRTSLMQGATAAQRDSRTEGQQASSALAEPPDAPAHRWREAASGRWGAGPGAQGPRAAGRWPRALDPGALGALEPRQPAFLCVEVTATVTSAHKYREHADAASEAGRPAGRPVVSEPAGR